MKTNRTRYLFAGLLLLVLLVGLAFQNLTTNLSRPADPISYDSTAATQLKWLEYGRSEATLYGMVGNPTSEEIAVMTFGSYLTLIGSDANDNRLQRTSPVIVYQAFGNIPTLKGFGSGAGSTNIVGFTLVYDGANGQLLDTTAYVKGKPGKLDLSVIPADRGFSAQANVLPTVVQAMTPESSLGNNGDDDDDILPLPVAP